MTSLLWWKWDSHEVQIEEDALCQQHKSPEHWPWLLELQEREQVLHSAPQLSAESYCHQAIAQTVASLGRGALMHQLCWVRHPCEEAIVQHYSWQTSDMMNPNQT